MTDVSEQHIAVAGEFLIRAAAALDAMPEALRDGLGIPGQNLNQALYQALMAAADLSPALKESLRQHGRQPLASLLKRNYGSVTAAPGGQGAGEHGASDGGNDGL